MTGTPTPFVNRSSRMLAAFFGSRQIDIDVSSTVPNLLQPTRHYERVTDLVREIIEACIWIGFHYRDSMTTGVNVGVGWRVGRWRVTFTRSTTMTMIIATTVSSRRCR